MREELTDCWTAACNQWAGVFSANCNIGVFLIEIRAKVFLIDLLRPPVVFTCISGCNGALPTCTLSVGNFYLVCKVQLLGSVYWTSKYHLHCPFLLMLEWAWQEVNREEGCSCGWGTGLWFRSRIPDSTQTFLCDLTQITPLFTSDLICKNRDKHTSCVCPVCVGCKFFKASLFLNMCPYSALHNGIQLSLRAYRCYLKHM